MLLAAVLVAHEGAAHRPRDHVDLGPVERGERSHHAGISAPFPGKLFKVGTSISNQKYAMIEFLYSVILVVAHLGRVDFILVSPLFAKFCLGR